MLSTSARSRAASQGPDAVEVHQGRPAREDRAGLCACAAPVPSRQVTDRAEGVIRQCGSSFGLFDDVFTSAPDYRLGQSGRCGLSTRVGAEVSSVVSLHSSQRPMIGCAVMLRHNRTSQTLNPTGSLRTGKISYLPCCAHASCRLQAQSELLISATTR